MPKKPTPPRTQYRSGLAAAILGLEALFSPKLCHNFLNIKFQAMIPHSNRIAIEFWLRICLENLYYDVNVNLIKIFVEPL